MVHHLRSKKVDSMRRNTFLSSSSIILNLLGAQFPPPPHRAPPQRLDRPQRRPTRSTAWCRRPAILSRRTPGTHASPCFPAHQHQRQQDQEQEHGLPERPRAEPPTHTSRNEAPQYPPASTRAPISRGATGPRSFRAGLCTSAAFRSEAQLSVGVAVPPRQRPRLVLSLVHRRCSASSALCLRLRRRAYCFLTKRNTRMRWPDTKTNHCRLCHQNLQELPRPQHQHLVFPLWLASSPRRLVRGIPRPREHPPERPAHPLPDLIPLPRTLKCAECNQRPRLSPPNGTKRLNFPGTA
mmetsp:Transcript_6077/g.15010  ORF Transcript_6077/g.15010 Transcript_6077/m.15010 type:complete len:295 (-) Transcript_6077:1202-2086(-)